MSADLSKSEAFSILEAKMNEAIRSINRDWNIVLYADGSGRWTPTAVAAYKRLCPDAESVPVVNCDEP